MPNVLIPKLSAIGNALRSKTNGGGSLTLEEMAETVNTIKSGKHVEWGSYIFSWNVYLQTYTFSEPFDNDEYNIFQTYIFRGTGGSSSLPNQTPTYGHLYVNKTSTSLQVQMKSTNNNSYSISGCLYNFVCYE